MRLFYFLLPGCFYANGPIEVENEQDARRWIRESIDAERLPKGTQVWETTRREQGALARNYEETQRGLPAWASGPL
jgi:hypothetical protein